MSWSRWHEWTNLGGGWRYFILSFYLWKLTGCYIFLYFIIFDCTNFWRELVYDFIFDFQRLFRLEGAYLVFYFTVKSAKFEVLWDTWRTTTQQPALSSNLPCSPDKTWIYVIYERLELYRRVSVTNLWCKKNELVSTSVILYHIIRASGLANADIGNIWKHVHVFKYLIEPT